MTLSKQLNKSVKEGYVANQDEMEKLLLKLDLMKMRKSISIKQAVKNRIR